MTTWILIRAAGVAAYVMLFLAVAWGLVSTTTPFGKRISKPSSTLVHQFMSTCGLFLLGVHVGLLLFDSFMPFDVLDVLIPFRATYRPVAVTLGIIALDATVIVVVTSWLRKRIGTVVWRRIHLLAVPAFALSLLHGILAGADASRPWMWWTYVATGLTVLFLIVVRALTADLRPERAPRPSHARPEPAPKAVGTQTTLETS
jgi:DMSO/TMAO reductase YedYZ heme-binding membrane subunit